MLILLGAGILVCCGVMTLAAFFIELFVESVRLRPHAGARAFEVFDREIQPRLKVTGSEGVRRYSMLKQTAVILAATGFLVLIGGFEPGAWATLLEALLLSFSALVIFGHILPSILVSRTTGQWAVAAAGPMRMLGWAIQPLVLLTSFARSVAELGGKETELARGDSAEEIAIFLDVGEEEGFIGREDRKLIQSVIEFGDKTVREVMTPRPEVVAIDADATVEELRQVHIDEEYSRVPVYEGSIDKVIGFVHSRDTLEIEPERRKTMHARDLMRPISAAPETKLIRELMQELQQRNQQMAVVVDEYGQTAGLVTMEDMMEEIVGEIRDESEPDHDVMEYPDHSFVASGNLDLDRLEELIDFRPDEGVESTTLGGLVCEQLGQVPDPGARLRLDGIEIEVLSADERRVRSLRVRRAAPAPDPSPQSGGEPPYERERAS